MTSPGASVDHVVGRLGALMVRVRTVVEARTADDPTLDDPFLGLYISDDRAHRILAGPRPTPSSPEAAELAAEVDRGAVGSRLAWLAGELGLDAVDVELLLIAMAPDVDARFEQLYGFCNDDVTLRRATVGLALTLAGAHPAQASARARFDVDAPLRRHDLIRLDQLDRPFLGRSLLVPDRVTSFLLGGDEPDPFLAGVLATPVAFDDDLARRLALVIGEGVGLVHLIDPLGRAAEVAAGALARLDRALVPIDLGRTTPGDDLAELARVAAREARLVGGVLFAGPIDVLIDRGADPAERLRPFAEQDCPVVLAGSTSWDPSWARGVPLQIALDRRAERTRVDWTSVAPELPAAVTAPVEGQFRLGPAEIQRATVAATMLASWHGEELSLRHLRAGARQQNGARLERLARRLEPAVGWDDLVLPESVRSSLERLASRARHRTTVLGDWGMRPGGGRGFGVTALFAGDSGTGKTMSAEVLAHDLGLDLYVVNLATVVDKYVGETEKNLDRIFTDADTVNGVLLFDEADALFGSRSEVRDSHDRYANLEIAYLLQRMETFDGLAVLSTNLRANLDEAFARRLDATIEFPVPEADLRLRLWQSTLAPLDLADEVDLEFCAAQFELTGGNIRSAGVTAAYAAATAGDLVTMPMMIRAIAEEYRKLGRLCLDAEFGEYHHLTLG